MKRIFIYSLLVSLFISCTSKTDSNQMLLHGEIRDLRKGTVYLERQQDTNYITIDSINLYGTGEFSFSQKLDSPELLHLHVKLDNGELIEDRITVFAEAGEISLNANLKEFDKPKITGSENHEKLVDFYKFISRYDDQQVDLLLELIQAQQDGDEELATKLEKDRHDAKLRSYLGVINFAIQNKDYDVAAFVMLQEAPEVHPRMLDSVYKNLNSKVREGLYGKMLEQHITSVKKNIE